MAEKRQLVADPLGIFFLHAFLCELRALCGGSFPEADRLPDSQFRSFFKVGGRGLETMWAQTI